MAGPARTGDINIGTIQKAGSVKLGNPIPSTPLGAALAYAALGIKVFRVRRDKTPYANCRYCAPLVGGQPNPQYIEHRPEACQCDAKTCHGFWAATTDTNLIRKWWMQEPEANVGGPCKLNGWAVIDIDPRHDGDLTLRHIETKVGVLPGTVMQISGGDGLHILYRSPGVDLPGTLGPGIDVKHNGYILLAPSVHKSGYRYQWSGDGLFYHPTITWPSVLMPQAPQRPAHQPAPSVPSAGATRFMPALLKVVLEAREGERNSRLYWAACRAYEHAAAGEIPEATAEGCLIDAAHHVGISESEARQTLASARNSARTAA
ncbi:bifunctional DNA primase/polymerase [Streptomyces sp. NPDC048275]|uniref:bifunctional DNA primase/polymerase n=1 Tax=Streptomyces sp. NPDC048275 TaxID=3155629 RepID=UPI003410C814